MKDQMKTMIITLTRVMTKKKEIIMLNILRR